VRALLALGNATAIMAALWPSRVRKQSPVATLHSFAVVSADPVSALSPSAEKATAPMAPAWPFRVCKSSRISGLHNLATLSEATRTSAPSSESATATEGAATATVAAALLVAASSPLALAALAPALSGVVDVVVVDVVVVFNRPLRLELLDGLLHPPGEVSEHLEALLRGRCPDRRFAFITHGWQLRVRCPAESFLRAGGSTHDG